MGLFSDIFRGFGRQQKPIRPEPVAHMNDMPIDDMLDTCAQRFFRQGFLLSNTSIAGSALVSHVALNAPDLGYVKGAGVDFIRPRQDLRHTMDVIGLVYIGDRDVPGNHYVVNCIVHPDKISDMKFVKINEFLSQVSDGDDISAYFKNRSHAVFGGLKSTSSVAKLRL